jgi:PAS domain S-box-containing protein
MSEGRFEALFDAMPEAIVLVEYDDGDPIVRGCNDTFQRRFGYGADTLGGESLNEYIVPEEESRARTAGEIDAAAARGERVEREVTRLTADGTRDFLFRAAPFREAGTTISVGIYVDVTDRRRERQRYEALIENASDVVTILDADGTIRYESPSIERVLGYDPQDLVGENAFEYIHPEDRPAVVEEFEAAVADPDATPTVEYRFRDADGEWRVLESVGSNHIDTPPIEGYVVNSRDVTERVERVRRLEWYEAYVEYRETEYQLSEAHVELNVLEAEHSDDELRDSEEYARLADRIDELEDELAAIEEEYDDIPGDGPPI